MPRKKCAPELTQIMDRCVVDPDEFDAWIAAKGYAWQGIDRGDYGFTLEQAQIRFVMEDPVRWCTAFLDDPDNEGNPWAFWDYQIESVRAWNQDVVHKDGAEVGKTREIIALILWGQCTAFGFRIPNPWILVGAPAQTHLDEIILALEYHVGAEEITNRKKPFLNHFWRRPKKHPHYMARFASPMGGGEGRVYFRPAGHDGEAFRGVHVNAMALMDEAAKIKHKITWAEFRRAKKPICVERIYSVPDGDNQTDFHQKARLAIEGLPKGSPGFRLFHWPKMLMPAPFYTKEREQKWVRDYGGKDSPGYQRNVLGEDGQIENSVFDSAMLSGNIKPVSKYRCIRLLGDKAKDEVDIEAYLIDTVSHEGAKAVSQREHLREDITGYSDFEDNDLQADTIWRLLSDVVETPDQGIYWIGGDLGYLKDPTEIRVWQELGEVLKCVFRLHMKGMGYDIQCNIIDGIDRLFHRSAGWGIDFGHAGSAVVPMLQNGPQYEESGLDERLMGYQFSTAVDATDEDGYELTEIDPKTENEKAIRMPLKQLATGWMQKRLQRQTLIQPDDEDAIAFYQNHTAREGAKHLIYSKDDDHVIDADRVMMLRMVFDEEMGGNDVFFSQARERA